VVEKVFADNPDWAGIVRMPHVPIREGQLEGVIGGEEIFKIALHPTIIAAASRLIGKNLIFWGGEIFAKPAGTGVRTPWHQDCYTPAVQAGPGRERPRSVMIWIAVDDVGLDNGCLRFIPGSGKAGRLSYIARDNATNLLNFEVEGNTINEASAVDGVLPSGKYSCHDLFVVHGANANVSGRRRAGLTFHYMAAEDSYDRSFGAAKGSGKAQPAPIANRPIWLVLGENKNPINDFVTGHQNLEDLDELAEATRRKLTALYS
jgi:ectoine hydroxylase-related dioxygenase (phytanoyl-CoA dioxygenase family)